MKHLQLFEGYGERKITLTSRQGRIITFDVIHGVMKNITNESGMNFPYVENRPYHRNVENVGLQSRIQMERRKWTG